MHLPLAWSWERAEKLNDNGSPGKRTVLGDSLRLSSRLLKNYSGRVHDSDLFFVRFPLVPKKSWNNKATSEYFSSLLGLADTIEHLPEAI